VCDEAVSIVKGKDIDCSIVAVDSTIFSEQVDALVDICYYGLTSKGLEIEVPILVVEDDETERFEIKTGEDVILALKSA